MRVAVSPERAVLAPGEDIELEIVVLNDGEDPVSPVVGISGVDPAFVTLPDSLVAVSPGERITAIVAVRIPEDAVPGEQRVGVSVADADGGQRVAATAVLVEVGARPDVSVELNPTAVKGRRKAVVDTILRNRSDEVQQVTLAGAGQGVEVTFAADEIVLEPREEVQVRTWVTRTERSWLREIRHGALVDVRGEGLPVSATATYTQKPLIPVWWRKLVAVVAALSLWAGVVVVVNNQLLGPSPDAPAAGPAEEEEPQAAPEADADALPSRPLVVQGTIDGPRDPSGTMIVLERISFGDEGTLDDDDGGSKLAALTPVAAPRATVIDKIETSTDESGRFRIAGGIEPDVFYRLTVMRPGFQVLSVVVTLSEDDPEIDLPLSLEPGDGAISGRVLDQDGRGLGGAEVLVTDGALVYQTTAATDGTVGAWSISGLATPGSYQVIASRQGYATATDVVDLEGGQSVSGVDLTVQLGLGTLRGQVSHRGQGVGALTVELAGPEDRTTTTLTDAGLAGRFDLPALPLGTYTLTFSGPGWLTQTTEVVLDRGEVVVDVRDLSPATAVIQGFVYKQVAPGGGCLYPDPDIPAQRANAVLAPCGGVGVSLVGDEVTYRTTSANGDGSFQFTGVQPGEYSLAFTRYGYYSEFYDVAVSAGDIITIPRDVNGSADSAITVAGSDTPRFQLTSTAGVAPTAEAQSTDAYVAMRLLPAPTDDVGEITGILRDSRDPNAVLQHEDLPSLPQIWVEEQPLAEVQLLADGAFRISRLLPGAHTVNIAAPGYDVYTFVARVGRAQPADAGPVSLIPFGSLNMRVIDGGDFAVPNATVFVTTADPALVGRLNVDNADPAFEVRRCTISRDDAGRWREGEAGNGQDPREGLCATVAENGDVFLNQALPTGQYEVIAPVNEDDISAECPFDARIAVVPMDHEQTVREIDIRSGETARPDVRLRRYAVIQGIIRKAEDFQPVDPDIFGAEPGRLREVVRAFPDRVGEFAVGVEFRGYRDGADEPFTPPPGLEPRFCFGPESGLNPGQYRISRVLNDAPGVSYEYELEIRAENGDRARFLRPYSTAIDGLSFGQTRIANAVLAPRPLDIELSPVWELSSGETRPVLGLSADLDGLVSLSLEEGNVVEVRDRITLPGDDTTGVMTTVDRFFQDNMNLQAEFLEGRSLAVELSGLPAYYERELDVADGELAAEDDDGPDDPIRGTLVPQAPPDSTVFRTDLIAEPLARSVVGTVEMPVGDINALISADDLDVELIPVDASGAPTTASVRTATLTPFPEVDGESKGFTFRFDGVRPDRYRFEVRSSQVVDIVLGNLLIEPGPVGVEVGIGPRDRVRDPGTIADLPAFIAADPFEIDREVEVTIGVFERFDDTGLFPATATAFSAIDPEDALSGVTVTLRRNGQVLADDRYATELSATLTTGPEGVVTFEGLRGGSARNYTVDLSAPGYVAVTGVPLLALVDDDGVATPSRLVTDTEATDRLRALNADVRQPNLTRPDNQRIVELVRKGEVAGHVQSLVDATDRSSGAPLAALLAALLEDGALASGTQASDLRATGTTATTTFALCALTDPICATPLDSGPLTLGADGSFRITGLEARGAGLYDVVTYLIRFSAENHAPLTYEIDIANGRVNTTGVRYLEADRVSISGRVTDDATPSGIPHVRVDLLEDGPVGALYRATGATATTQTDGDGRYEITGLPPLDLLGIDVLVRFTEFADATLSVETSRYVQEITADPFTAGAVLVDQNIVLLRQFVALQGDISGFAFHRGEPPYPIGPNPGDLGPERTVDYANAIATVTCTAGGCMSLGSPYTATVSVSTSDSGMGFYRFEVLPTGTYTLTIQAPGYEDVVVTGIDIVRVPEDTPGGPAETGDDVDGPGDRPWPTGLQVRQDISLIASLVDVPVTVTTVDAADSDDLNGRGLADVEVVAHYQPEDGEAAPTVGTFTVTTDANGRGTFVLPPASWTFETRDANRADVDPRPHLDAESPPFEVQVATTSALATQTAPSVVLEPYVAVDGAVFGRTRVQDVGEDYDLISLSGVTVTPTVVTGVDLPVYTRAVGQEPTTDALTASPSAWTALVPPVLPGDGAEAVRLLELGSPGYASALASVSFPTQVYDITLADPATPSSATVSAVNLVGAEGDYPPDVIGQGIVLTGVPRGIHGVLTVNLATPSVATVFEQLRFELVATGSTSSLSDVASDGDGVVFERGVIAVQPASATLRFQFEDVELGQYLLQISGPDVVTYTSETFFNAPPSPQRLDLAEVLDPIVVTPLVAVDLTVFERFDEGWGPLLNPATGPADLDEVASETVESVNVDLVPVDGGTAVATGTADGDGSITFVRVEGGTDIEYEVVLSKAGYLDGPASVSASTTVTFEQLNNVREARFVRFGEVAGSVEWVIDVVRDAGVSLDDAYVAVVDDGHGLASGSTDSLRATFSTATQIELRASDTGVTVASVTAGSEGEFLFGGSLGQQFAAGDYELRLSATHSDLTITGVEIQDARRNNVGVRYPLADRASLSGAVTDQVTDQDLPNVLVEVGRLDGEGNFAHLLLADGSPATTTTATGTGYTFEGLPPVAELGETVVVRFTEFADEDLDVETTRYVQEIEVDDLFAGAEVERDVRLLGQYVAVAGEVTLRAFDGGPTYTLGELGLDADDVEISIACTAGACLNGGVTTSATTTLDTATPTDGTIGRYQFEVLPVGTYEVTISVPGFEDAVEGAVLLVRFDADDDDGDTDPATSSTNTEGDLVGIGRQVDLTLDATPAEVVVEVTSIVDRPLAGVTVTPTYDTDGGAFSEPTVTATTPTTGTDGLASFLLPPGTWTFDTAGANRAPEDDQRPHLDAEDAALTTFTVNTVQPGARIDVELGLEPYVALTGTILGRDVPDDAAATVTLDTVTVTPTQGSDGLAVYRDPDGPASATAWTVFVPPTPDDDPIDRAFEVASADYDGALVTVTVPTNVTDVEVSDPASPTSATVTTASLADGLPPAVTPDGVVLTASPTEVQITVSSWDYPATATADTRRATGTGLTGVTVSATPSEATTWWTPEIQDFYNASATSLDGGLLTLRLAPGEWLLSTTGAAAKQHVDVGVDGTDSYPPAPGLVTVTAPDSSFDLILAPWASVAGTARIDDQLLTHFDVRVFGLGEERDCPAEVPDSDPDLDGEFRSASNGEFELDGSVEPQFVIVEFIEYSRRGNSQNFDEVRRASSCATLKPGLNELELAPDAPEDLITGTVVASLIEDGVRAGLEGATVTATLLTTGTVTTTQTTDGGFFSLTGLEDAAIYELVAAAPGYEPSAPATFAAGTTGVELHLVAKERELVVTVTSAADGGSLEGAADTVTATLTSDAYPLATDGTDTDVLTRTATLTAAGDTATLTFDSVPPGTWTLGTAGFSDLPQPHVDLSDRQIIIELSEAPTQTQAYDIDRFPRIDVTIDLFAYIGLPWTEPLLATPTVTFEPAAATTTAVTYDQSAGQATVTGYLAPGDGTSVPAATVTADTAGFAAVTVGLSNLEVNTVATRTVNLFAERIEVLVTVTADTSVTTDTEVTLTATRYDDADLTTPTSPTQTGDTTATITVPTEGSAVAEFLLAPGGWWLLEAVGDGFFLDVVGANPFSLALDDSPVTRQATLFVDQDVLSGIVVGASFGDAEAEPVEGALVTATRGDEVATTTTDTSGQFRLEVDEVRTEYSLSISRLGYEPLPATATSGTPVGELRLQASPREVVITFTSSDDGDLSGGAAPTATLELEYTLTGGATATTSTTVTVVQSANTATATFDSVLPGTWTLSTSGFTLLSDPHGEVFDRVVAVPFSPEAVPPVGVVLQRYSRVTGEVLFAAYDTVPLASATMATPSDLDLTVDGPEGAVGTVTYDSGTSMADWSVAFPPGSNGTATVTVGTAEFDDVVVPFEIPASGTTDTPSRTVVAPSTEVRLELSLPEAATETVTTDITMVLAPSGDPGNPGITPPDSGNGYVLTRGSVTIATGEVATVATFSLPTGDFWYVTADDATFEITVGGDTSSDPSNGPFVVPLAAAPTDPLTVEATVNPNSKLFGQVVEDRDGTLVPLAGINIRAERDGRVFSTRSGELNDLGDNFMLQAQAGTWRISAVRHGVVTVIDEAFEIRRDGADTPRNWLQIVLPWLEAELAGRVTDETGAGVAGAVVTAQSVLGSVAVTSDEDGRYRLSGLDPDVTWRVTFTPPPGALAMPVTRFIAPGGFVNAELVLDQQLPSGYGHLQVNIDGALPGEALRVELSETTPFPTIDEDGRIVQQLTADAEGTASVLFEDLVPGGSTSLPADRFTVSVEGQQVSAVASNLAVLAGRTTEVLLVLSDRPGRDVEVVVSDADGPLQGVAVRLEADGTVLSGTAVEDSNRIRFLNVQPGVWQVVADGYLPAAITVSPGEDTQVVSVLLAADPDAVSDPVSPSEDTADDPPSEWETGDGADGTEDGAGDGTGDAPDGDSADPDGPAPDGDEDTTTDGGSDGGTDGDGSAGTDQGNGDGDEGSSSGSTSSSSSSESGADEEQADASGPATSTASTSSAETATTSTDTEVVTGD